MAIFPRPKVQFLALKDEISDLLSKGYAVLDIYNILLEEKKITMSYFSLNDYINVYIRGKEPKKKVKKVNEIKQLGENSKEVQHKVISSTKQTFGTKNYKSEENI